MISMYRYQTNEKRKDFPEIFKLDGTCHSFEKFAELVGE